MRPEEPIPSPAMPDPASDPPSERVLDAALRLLSARSRSVAELRRRLLKKGFDAPEADSCLQWLLERDLLNDGAFSRALIRDRTRFSPRSPLLLERELRDKGVAAAVAEEAVETVLREEGISPADLSAMAARVWVRKQSATSRKALLTHRFTPEREKARRRLYGFLARRGFLGDLARLGLEAGAEAARALEDETRSATD